MSINDINPFKTEPNQDIKARLTIKDFAPNPSVLDGSYSVYKFKGKSALNEPYSFNITFVSNYEIDIYTLSEKDVELEISDEHSLGNKKVYGKIIEAAQRSMVADKYMYKIKITCPLKYLHFSKRYRIFHDKTASDIIKTIINQYNASLNLQLEVRLDASKNVVRHYTTQYGESDLSFIQRLCEEEGYAMICDYTNSEVYPITLCELNDYAKEVAGITTGDYNFSKRFTSPHSIFKYYDEQRPSLELKKEYGKSITSSIKDNAFTSQLKSDIKHYEQKDMINYHKGSRYSDLSRYTQLHAQRQYVKASSFKGSSSELTMQDALLVTLKDESANKSAKIILLALEYEGHFPNALDEQTQDDNIDKAQYGVKFTAIAADIVFRPQIKTPKPKVKGMLTAIVSKGQANSKENANEIDVDNEGRIRVLLHFEEEQLTSCYIRLSSFYSGNGYGALFLPRINSEVIVNFENGDPDKPIITGAIHNGENKNPYPLPQTKTKSHIRTNSMPQHEDQIGFNEMSFEDKKDNEELKLRAQKDYKLMAQNDARIDIDNDQVENIINDSTFNVNHDHSITITNDQSIEVQNDQTNHIFENQDNAIDKDKIIQIGNEQKEDVYGKYDLKVGDKSSTEVGGNHNLKAKNKIIKLTDIADLKANEIILKSPGGTIILGGSIVFKGPVTIKGGLAVSGGSGGGSPLSIESLIPFVSNASNKEGTKEEIIELEVEEIVTYKMDKDTINCVAILNLANVSDEDIAKIRWTVEDELQSEYNGLEDIQHNLKEKGLEKVHFAAYIDVTQSEHALGDVTYTDTKPKNRKTKAINT
jgi:type VI secretion system secreted protein VgrG